MANYQKVGKRNKSHEYLAQPKTFYGFLGLHDIRIPNGPNGERAVFVHRCRTSLEVFGDWYDLKRDGSNLMTYTEMKWRILVNANLGCRYFTITYLRFDDFLFDIEHSLDFLT